MHIIPQAHHHWGDRISSLPWNKKEVKAHLKRRYNEDEQKLISILAKEGSVACYNYEQLSLNRSLIKATLKSLDEDRKKQMTFASIACGTFFKYYNKGGERLPVRCPLCPATCSLHHILSHLKQEPPADMQEEEEWVTYLSALAHAMTPKFRQSLLPVPIVDAAQQQGE